MVHKQNLLLLSAKIDWNYIEVILKMIYAQNITAWNVILINPLVFTPTFKIWMWRYNRTPEECLEYPSENFHTFSYRLDAKKLQMYWNFSVRSNPRSRDPASLKFVSGPMRAEHKTSWALIGPIHLKLLSMIRLMTVF